MQCLSRSATTVGLDGLTRAERYFRRLRRHSGHVRLGTAPLRLGTAPLRLGIAPLRLGAAPLRLGALGAAVIASAAAAVLAAPLPVHAQDTGACDATTLRLGSGANPYGPRGDRCEGTYKREVAGETILAGVYRSFQPYDFDSDAPLIVEWGAPGVGLVSLRALSVLRGRYYRMDATLPSGTVSYEWPFEVLLAERLGRDHLGVQGWFDHRAEDGRTERVYLPLRIGRRGGPAAECVVTLVLLPGEEAKEVYVTLRGPGHDGGVLRRDQPLDWGYYPPETPIPIQLPELVDSGVYRVSISMRLRSGRTWGPTEYLLYHSGASEECM